MKLLVAAIMFVVSCLPVWAYTYNDAENTRYLADLNYYTLQAKQIVLVASFTSWVYPSRSGPTVTIRGRGPLREIAGIESQPASFVSIGHDCDGCTLKISRYHIRSDIDDIIAVYTEAP